MAVAGLMQVSNDAAQAVQPSYSVDTLKGIYKAQDSEGISQAHATRVQTLLALTKAVGLEDFRKVWKALIGETVKGSSERDVWNARHSEARKVWGATHFADLIGFKVPEGQGYKATVAACGEALKNAKLRWDGSPMISKEERKAEKQAAQDVAATMEGRKAYYKAINTGESPETAEARELEAREGYAAQVAKDTVTAICEGLAKKYDVPMLLAIADGLVAEAHRIASVKPEAIKPE